MSPERQIEELFYRKIPITHPTGVEAERLRRETPRRGSDVRLVIN